jgi:hypothetical protein
MKSTMKKQEMINVIMLEEKALYEAVQQAIALLGLDNEITQSAITRWSTVNKLVKSLGL